METYKEMIQRGMKGVAILKVDSDVRLWTRSATGVGFQIEGHRVNTGQNEGIIIKAKLDLVWVCPRELNRLKVFYRLYRFVDKNNDLRPYLVLNARSGDDPYRGKRVVCISRERGASIIWEPSWQEKIQRLKKEHLDRIVDDRSSTEHRESPECFNPVWAT